MDRNEEKRKIREQLATCRRLEAEFVDGVTARNLEQFAAELQDREARHVVQERMDDQRAIAEQIRRKMS
jgi:hypothetical protein